MKNLVVGLILLLAFSGFLAVGQKVTPVTKNLSYGVGEELTYRVNLSFFTVGKATTRIDKKYHDINSRVCYKVDAYGETSDWISWVSKVNDNWGGFIDTAALLPLVSYRKIKEGKYRRDELVNFDHANNKVEVRVRNEKTNEYDEPKVYDTPPNTKDMVAGFLYLRVIDYNKVVVGDTITIKGFFENAMYNLKIIYMGKEVVNTRIGKIPCQKLRPIMPKNSLFDGENAVMCWVSDDLNHIPVKLQAKMFIGSTGLELISLGDLEIHFVLCSDGI